MTEAGRGAEAIRWGVAGAVVLAVHVAGGVWATVATQRSLTQSLPAPVFAELLPEPAAPAAVPAAEGAAETTPAPEPEPEPEPAEFTPPPLPGLPPVADLAERLPDTAPGADFDIPPLSALPPVTDFSALLPDSALLLPRSARPKSRPAPPEPEPRVAQGEAPRDPPNPPRREPAREQPPQQAKPQEAPKSAASAPAASTQRGGRAQGEARANPGASKQQMDSWTSRVGGRVAAHMKRTRIPGGGRGMVTIRLSVSISGNGATSARLVSSTGYGQVDAALTRQAGRMPRMPAPPDGRGVAFVLPIRIDL